MGVRNPNSTDYVHADEPNLLNIHKALDYTTDGEPALRVLSNIQGDITIEGNVTIPGEVTVTTDADNPLYTHTHIYTPNDEQVSDTNPFAVNVFNFPATQTVDGTVNIGTMPSVTVNQPVAVTDNNGSLTVDGNVSISFNDTANNTAFGRLRTAGTRLLGEFRNQYGTMGPVEIVSKFETGGTQTINLAGAHVLLNVTTTAGSRALRQSRKYHPYIPGTTNLTFVTFTFGTAKTNLQQMVGLFDDLNGIFFRMNGNTPEMVIRKGGVDNEVVAQSLWNVDKLDGTGASGIDIDFTKSQIFVVDYQWLGVGRVRVGFSLNGRVYYTHYFTHLNELTEPYMYQPSLPVRWEIKNTGTTASVSSMMCICFSVYVEGSDAETGFDNSVSNGTTAVTLAAAPNNIKGILAIRLKNTVNGQPNRAVARVKDWEIVSSLTAQYKVMILQGIADLEGTPVWADATPTGWCEYTTDFRLANPPSPANAVVLFDGYAVGAVGNRPQRTGFASDNRSSAIYQNYDSTDSMILAIVAYRIPNDNAAIRASLNWVETK